MRDRSCYRPLLLFRPAAFKIALQVLVEEKIGGNEAALDRIYG